MVNKKQYRTSWVLAALWSIPSVLSLVIAYYFMLPGDLEYLYDTDPGWIYMNVLAFMAVTVLSVMSVDSAERSNSVFIGMTATMTLALVAGLAILLVGGARSWILSITVGSIPLLIGSLWVASGKPSEQARSSVVK